MRRRSLLLREMDVVSTQRGTCTECLLTAEVSSHFDYLMCEECAAIVLKYYRACSAVQCEGRVHPARGDDVTLCCKCFVPPSNDWPCSSQGCEGRVDAKWKTTCTACFIKAQRSKEAEGDGKPFSKPCSKPGCRRTVDAKRKTTCPTCYGKRGR